MEDCRVPVFQKGSFSINLGIVSVGGELSEDDRQCAWELYCELVSRVALVGKEDQRGKLVFTGEVYSESLDSVYAFVREARALMRRYPVGRVPAGHGQNHLGAFIAALLEVVVRPFLEKWQATYRHWWARACADIPEQSPFDRQAEFPLLEPMLEDWRDLRRFCRAAARELTQAFALPDVMALEPPQLKHQWLKETATLLAKEKGGV
jgi:hypothetical protein